MSAAAARCGRRWSRSVSSGPRALSDRPLIHELVVLCVGAYPKPRHVFADFTGERPVVKADPCRPERADFLEVEGRMLWVSLQQTKAPIGQFPELRPAVHGSNARTARWPGASQRCGATGANLSPSLARQSVEPPFTDVALKLLIPRGCVAFGESLPEAFQIALGQPLDRSRDFRHGGHAKSLLPQNQPSNWNSRDTYSESGRRRIYPRTSRSGDSTGPEG